MKNLTLEFVPDGTIRKTEICGNTKIFLYPKKVIGNTSDLTLEAYFMRQSQAARREVTEIRLKLHHYVPLEDFIVYYYSEREQPVSLLQALVLL